MMPTTFPGQPRKTLASQLDRLESILNNLQGTLQSAVSVAVEKAVGQAIQDAVPALLTALLSNAQVLTILQSRAATAAPPAAPACGAVRGACQWLDHRIRTAWHPMQTSCRLWLGHVVQHSSWLAAGIKRLCRCICRGPWACGVGLGMSFIICWAGPWLGVMVGFMAGFLFTLAVQDWQRLRTQLATLIADE
ncbi:MAG TPA: hypothetical protein VH682_23300 [Gemmataceae bacterium]|jgi:hypothetical protein